MRVQDTDVRIVRLRRVLAAAEHRHARRHSRSSTIWFHFKGYYGRHPRLTSQWNMNEEWDGTHRRWCYEDAYQLELEASILLNWLLVLLDQAGRERVSRGGYPLLRRVS